MLLHLLDSVQCNTDHDQQRGSTEEEGLDVECVEYEELGMEAVWRIEVEDFPAFIVVDDKGNDFFAQLNAP